MTGADLENLVNEAALFAARQNKERVDNTDFESAKDKVFMGPERKSMIMTEKEKRNTAVHEAGHALVAKLLPGCDPVHKVTIIPAVRRWASPGRCPPRTSSTSTARPPSNRSAWRWAAASPRSWSSTR
jgi:ATP-dependent Zn protease